MERFIQYIDTNKTLNKVNRANNRTRKFHLLIVIYMLTYYFTNDTRLGSLWPLIELIYIFVISTSIARETIPSLTTSSLIGLLSLIITSSLKTEFLIIYAILISLILTSIYQWTHYIKIKSKNIPPAVIQTIQSLIQEFLVIASSWILYNMIQANVIFTDKVFHTILSTLASLPGILIIVLAVTSLWSAGYHGATIINKLIRIAYMQILISNLSAFISSQTIPYIGAETFYQWVMWVGGSGTTIGLAIALRYFTQNRKLQTLGKSAINSAIFNINEEILFGLPIVQNKHYLIPFVLAPLINAALVYNLIQSNFINYPLLPISWVIAGPIGLFISSFFDFKALFVGILVILISLIVYLPFVLKDDKKRQVKEVMS